MKMTRRNFLSTSAVAAFACGASLTAHAAGSTDENSLNFITDIFKDSPNRARSKRQRRSRQKRTPNGMKSWIFQTGGSLPTQNAAGWTMRKVRSSTPRMANLHGICRATAI